MNRIFQEYTTSTAFSLSLSKLQCNCLLRIVAEKDPRDNLYVVSVDTLQGLARRGLVAWHKDKEGVSCGYYVTKAGKLVAELLTEAGLTVGNTNTLRTLRAMGLLEQTN